MKNWILIISLILNLVFVSILTLKNEPANIIESNQPKIVQTDKSVIIERKTDTVLVKPQIPKGSVITRQISILVHDTVPAEHDTLIHINDCPPVPVDLTLIKLTDGSQRVIARVPGGEIINGVDVPIISPTPLVLPKVWSTGLTYDPFKKSLGGYIDRDISRLRIGTTYLDKTLSFKVGFTF